jgi:hypothetical protein
VRICDYRVCGGAHYSAVDQNSLKVGSPTVHYFVGTAHLLCQHTQRPTLAIRTNEASQPHATVRHFDINVGGIEPGLRPYFIEDRFL